MSTTATPAEVADEHGLREVVGDPAQADQASGEVHDADEDGEGRREHRVLDAAGRCQWGQSGRHEQRHRPLGSDDESRRGAEHGVRQHRQEQAVQTGGERHTGDPGVGHRGRKGEGRHCDTGDCVGSQPFTAVRPDRTNERGIPRRQRRPARRRESASTAVRDVERLHRHRGGGWASSPPTPSASDTTSPSNKPTALPPNPHRPRQTAAETAPTQTTLDPTIPTNQPT